MEATQQDNRAVVAAALEHLTKYYVFPDVAAQMAAVVQAAQEAGTYDQLEGEVLAVKLTEDLRSVSHDLHLRIRYWPEPQPPMENVWDNPEYVAQYREDARLLNYDFHKVERLPGGVGYIKFDEFHEPIIQAETAAAAMALVANTSALIIDLRQNGGGDPEMVAFMCSYFFDKRTHLNSMYDRLNETSEQFWTLPHVPGRRYLDKPVYVLTSRKTFSGAEEFSYNLKMLKRATIVGETTGGGAHPTDRYQLSPHFTIGVPTGRAINPISNTNWEGTGIEPDIATSAEAALTIAHRHALTTILHSLGEPINHSYREYRDEVVAALADLPAE